MKSFFHLISVVFLKCLFIASFTSQLNAQGNPKTRTARTQFSQTQNAGQAKSSEFLLTNEATSSLINITRGFSLEELQRSDPNYGIYGTTTGAFLKSRFPASTVNQSLEQAIIVALNTLASLMKERKAQDPGWVAGDQLYAKLTNSQETRILIDSLLILFNDLLINEWQYERSGYQVVYHNSPQIYYDFYAKIMQYIQGMDKNADKKLLLEALSYTPLVGVIEFLEQLNRRFEYNARRDGIPVINGKGPYGFYISPGNTKYSERNVAVATFNLLIIPRNFEESILYHFLSATYEKKYPGYFIKELLSRLLPGVPEDKILAINNQLVGLHTSMLAGSGGQLVQEFIPLKNLRRRAYVSWFYGVPVLVDQHGNILKEQPGTSPVAEPTSPKSTTPNIFGTTNARNIQLPPPPPIGPSPKRVLVGGPGESLMPPEVFIKAGKGDYQAFAANFQVYPQQNFGGNGDVITDFALRLLVGPQFEESVRKYFGYNAMDQDKIKQYVSALNSIAPEVVKVSDDIIVGSSRRKELEARMKEREKKEKEDRAAIAEDRNRSERVRRDSERNSQNRSARTENEEQAQADAKSEADMSRNRIGGARFGENAPQAEQQQNQINTNQNNGESGADLLKDIIGAVKQLRGQAGQ